MSPTKPVDLDALEKLYAASTQGEWDDESLWADGSFYLMRGEGFQYEEDGKFASTAHNTMPALIAELREPRELVGMATVYELRMATVRCVPTRCGDECEWYCERDSGSTTVHATLPEALAAARKWEAENA